MTESKTISIRDVDKDVYKLFKIKCLEHECSVGTAISEAMHIWTLLDRKKVDEPSL